MQALELCNRFGEVAEQEQHHPDLHITVRVLYFYVPVQFLLHAYVVPQHDRMCSRAGIMWKQMSGLMREMA